MSFQRVAQLSDIPNGRGLCVQVDGVDVGLFRVEGEIHAICGENGAGKSTLMKVLSGVYPTGSYDGQIVFDGEVADFRTIRDSEAQALQRYS